MTIREAKDVCTHANMSKIRHDIARDGASFDYKVLFNNGVSFTNYKKAIKYVDELVRGRE